MTSMHEQNMAAVARLLGEQNRDRYSPTYGCFDRRFWAWKLTDFPESTYQRNVQPLAMSYANNESSFYHSAELLRSIEAGFRFALSIQHSNGSFDQAFPNENSFGATGFNLYSLADAFRIIREVINSELRESIEDALRRAGDFLCKHEETHSHIANHLAGAAVGLELTCRLLKEDRFHTRGITLIEDVLENQSDEGWYLEYEGADPGYQTLCMHYLAEYLLLAPTEQLQESLDRAVDFISHFVHPDGTFAGEYGSRRTAVYYPGGLAILAESNPLAASISAQMLKSIEIGNTVTVATIDVANVAPLLTSNMLCEKHQKKGKKKFPRLPFESKELSVDFKQAGMHLRSTTSYYAVFGSANGGVLKVFDKAKHRAIWNDGGYIGELANGKAISTQTTKLNPEVSIEGSAIRLTTPFQTVLNAQPSPALYMALRAMNLTLMRNIYFGNLIKGLMVRTLISGKKPSSLNLERVVTFNEEEIIVDDRLTKNQREKISWMEFGRPFIAVHMASAGYFEGAQADSSIRVPDLDVAALNKYQELNVKVTIGLADA